MLETKFTDEEMVKIKDIQKQYFDVQSKLGQSAISKLRLAQQIDGINVLEEELTKRFIEIQEDEQKFIAEITKKYGEGTLNPESGIFITK